MIESLTTNKLVIVILIVITAIALRMIAKYMTKIVVTATNLHEIRTLDDVSELEFKGEYSFSYEVNTGIWRKGSDYIIGLFDDHIEVYLSKIGLSDTSIDTLLKEVKQEIKLSKNKYSHYHIITFKIVNLNKEFTLVNIVIVNWNNFN